MYLGPRLVIPGVIFGSLFLAFFLFMVTAGMAVPPSALAAQPAATAAPDLPSADLVEVEGLPEAVMAEVDAVGVSDISAQDCPISARFPKKILQWCGLISHYASKRNLDPDLIAALILQESGGNSEAYSHSGAVGLMQVMPRDGLASSFMCPAGPCFSNRPSTEELRDPEFNISYGTKLLAGLLQKHGNIRDALKSYGPMDVGYYYADIVLGHQQNYGN